MGLITHYTVHPILSLFYGISLLVVGVLVLIRAILANNSKLAVIGSLLWILGMLNSYLVLICYIKTILK